ncbi:shikimate kinase AroK [Alkalilimnicola ehrlichii]|uniref:Shikimate kinase n=1 Tax=Alkalilimnicola ehrlichii TaxID=351052 RepID=A0A3E0X3E4_9GAMM|nr:shikimate kinase AroK [Alkalilimnicola ehrlichii]RFA39558.1 shikimate kinase I [Alkalilimnicola ehrlichii]
MESDRIFLVGPMGAGKSTVGKRLAQTLGLEFVDSDRALEERTGARIPLIFELEGETGFRQREAAIIDELTQQPGLVLATGGGAVVTPANRRYLAERGTVVYLETSVDRQLARTRHDKNRPLLQTANPQARLAELLAQRDPLYREIADIIANTDHGKPNTVVKAIVSQLKSSPQSSYGRT